MHSPWRSPLVYHVLLWQFYRLSPSPHRPFPWTTGSTGSGQQQAQHAHSTVACRGPGPGHPEHQTCVTSEAKLSLGWEKGTGNARASSLSEVRCWSNRTLRWGASQSSVLPTLLFCRNLEGNVALRSSAAVFTYCKSRGLFAGLSLEGSCLIERKETNRK